jgi:hypothetical protein
MVVFEQILHIATFVFIFVAIGIITISKKIKNRN